MNIEIGDFKITADGAQFILWKKAKKSERSLKPGEEYFNLCGYYTTFVSCLYEIPKYALLRSGASSLDDVITIMNRYNTLISRHFELTIPEPKKIRRTK